MYDETVCPNCHGTAETPTHEPCPRCEAFGYVVMCLATRPGQREAHDREQCSHYVMQGAS